MNIVVAVDKRWAIGNKGQLLVSIPKDHKNFRELTTGKVVVLGRKTLDTFPGKQPLKNRTNIILSRNPGFSVKDAVTVNSVEALLEELKKYPSEDVYIIGGDSVYRQLLPYCDTAIVTRIDHRYEADAFFPDLDKDEEWEQVSESDVETYFDLEYRFVTYKKKA
ncbi:MAG: dihydrofolate reductase [Lachnospiraceae bacterium]|nr:dihydrofolate reductase [Lachnospiraceae bacterium]